MCTTLTKVPKRTAGGPTRAVVPAPEGAQLAWPNLFFTIYLSTMLTKTEQKFYFSSPSSLHNTSTLQHTSGHPPAGWSLPEFWTTGHVLGLDAPIFFPS